LRQAVAADHLMPPHEIDLAFIRPKTETQRPLAYAQAQWMLEFLLDALGPTILTDMLAHQRDSRPADKLIRSVTGLSDDQFMRQFKAWAREQIATWQRHPAPTRKEAAALLDQPLGDSGDPTAIAVLEQMDAMDPEASVWAVQLARIHRRAGRLTDAADAISRALQREPYNATIRELAAAIAVQRDALDAALHQVKALTILEPDRAIHWSRLAAIHHRRGDAEATAAALERAKTLDPAVPHPNAISGPDQLQ